MCGNIFEGKTTKEAIDKGLQQLGLPKESVEIKVLEEDKRSFFSILSPRVVKVQIIPKVLEKENKTVINKRVEELNEKEIEKVKENINIFLDDFFQKMSVSNIECKITLQEGHIFVDVNGEDLNFLIGYRGEVLKHLQYLLASIANKGVEKKAKVILNICGYKEKREKSLEELAEKLEKTVIKTGKSVTLEPMSAYERKIIHGKLQASDKVKTTSIGEEPHRRVVISLK